MKQLPTMSDKFLIYRFPNNSIKGELNDYKNSIVQYSCAVVFEVTDYDENMMCSQRHALSKCSSYRFLTSPRMLSFVTSHKML